MGSYAKSALHIEVPNQMLGLSEEEAGIWMRNELFLLFSPLFLPLLGDGVFTAQALAFLAERL